MIHNDQLGSISVSLKCPESELLNMKLSETRSQPLVTAMREMRDRVQEVGLKGDVTLDIEDLTQNDGHWPGPLQ